MKLSAVFATGCLLTVVLATLEAATVTDEGDSGLLSTCCLPHAQSAAQIRLIQLSMAILDV